MGEVDEVGEYILSGDEHEGDAGSGDGSADKSLNESFGEEGFAYETAGGTDE